MNFASPFAYVNHSDSEEEEIVVDDSSFETAAPAAASAPRFFSARSGSVPVRRSVARAEVVQDSSSAGVDEEEDDNDNEAEGKREDTSMLTTMRRVLDRFSSSATPQAAAPPGVPPQHNVRRRQGKLKTFKRKVDTNVVSLTLGSLGENAPVATGDAVYCDGCSACLSGISTLTAQEGSEGTKWAWSCEFCGKDNVVEMEEEEKPSQDQKTVDYIIEHAGEAAAAAPVDGFTVFCIDISGSMCVTQEVKGDIKLLGDRRGVMAGLRGHGDHYDQRLPGEKRGITYVSRLQSVQAAVQSQLKHIADEHPTAKVAVITFNHEVTVIGDGSGQPTIISGDRLNNFEELLDRGKAVGNMASISECRTDLEDKLFKLEEGGPTALGPAVVTALGMCEGKPGARVVVCTDGLANIGLGTVEGLDEAEEAARDTADQFYDRVGQHAAEQGICIDVVGIRSQGCDLERLGRMAELANGNVSLVDPLNLHNDFHGILANAVVATQVSIKLLLHRGLQFRSTDTSTSFSPSTQPATVAPPSSQDSILHHTVGNVTTDTELSFEYQLRPTAERRAMGIGELTMLPFQLQITYTRLNGMKCVRVMTQSQPVTANRAEAEEQADFRVLSSHAAQQTAKMASAGVYTKSRGNMRAWGNFMTDIATNRSPSLSVQQERMQTMNMYSSDMNQLDSAVMRAQHNEEDEYGRTHSDSEDDVAPRANVSKARKDLRSKNDELSSHIQRSAKRSYR